MSDDNKDAQNAAGTTDDTKGGDDTSGTQGSTQGAAGTSNDTSSNDDKAADVVPRSEFEKLDARMRAADKRAAEAEQKAKELEREKLSESEKVVAELQDVTKERDSLRAELDDVKLENAFLSSNKHTWHDPQDALRLLDMEGVEIKDGKVIGLAEAVDKLAKAKPHLLKSDDEGGGKGKGSSAASGTANNGRRKGDKNDPPKNYSSRFPALRKPPTARSAS